MRQEYPLDGLTETDLARDWVNQFTAWLGDATSCGLAEPNAMAFATADQDGRPSARTVLLKAYDERGFVLFTNYGSRKATEALSNPYASLVFFWHPLHRQVVVCGTVERVSRTETEEYFADRPRGAQLGAWASRQSSVIPGREVLEAAWQRCAAQWPDDTPVPVPDHWGGLRVVPETVEFWQGRANRMHDRLRYRRTGSGWIVERLAP
ncbi:MAG TPA: pyridoxamine 5'-phosphate oxidase [Micromonosporaceae bacterium]